ncbi:hypothetical protein AX16_007515 [Volvariella volvacea WC 439]|nr:hypothetical protein AX16_007515 [Volvariella volvacea WC 439]
MTGVMRGMVMMACGASTRRQEHYDKAMQVVINGTFDFLLSFTEENLRFKNVEVQTIEFLKAIFIWNNSPWDALLSHLVNIPLLSHTSIVLTFWEGDKIHCRRVSQSWPHFNIWGFTPFCSECPARNAEQHIDWAPAADDLHGYARITCDRCHRKTRWVRRPDWVHPLRSPGVVYWHNYPLSEEQMTELQILFKKELQPKEVQGGDDLSKQSPSPKDDEQ